MTSSPPSAGSVVDRGGGPRPRLHRADGAGRRGRATAVAAEAIDAAAHDAARAASIARDAGTAAAARRRTPPAGSSTGAASTCSAPRRSPSAARDAFANPTQAARGRSAGRHRDRASARLGLPGSRCSTSRRSRRTSDATPRPLAWYRGRMPADEPLRWRRPLRSSQQPGLVVPIPVMSTVSAGSWSPSTSVAGSAAFSGWRRSARKMVALTSCARSSGARPARATR